jgi:hypothetical protein
MRVKRPFTRMNVTGVYGSRNGPYSQACCVSEAYHVPFSRPDKLRAGSHRPWVSVDMTTKWAVKRTAS